MSLLSQSPFLGWTKLILSVAPHRPFIQTFGGCCRSRGSSSPICLGLTWGTSLYVSVSQCSSVTETCLYCLKGSLTVMVWQWWLLVFWCLFQRRCCWASNYSFGFSLPLCRPCCSTAEFPLAVFRWLLQFLKIILNASYVLKRDDDLSYLMLSWWQYGNKYLSAEGWVL